MDGYARSQPPTAPAQSSSAPAEAPSQGGTLIRGNKDGTLLPPRALPQNSRYSSLLLARNMSLGSADLSSEVALPDGASEEEWLAVNTIDFFNELNLLHATTEDLCTDQTCPKMCAGSFHWSWADGDKYKQPVEMSAPKYKETLLLWVDRQLADENFLPVKPGVPFPPTFKKGLRTIYKRLFRIYAHTFHVHFKELHDDGAGQHVKHSFKHFVYFVKEFDLIDDAELEPLRDLVNLLMEKHPDSLKKKQMTTAGDP